MPLFLYFKHFKHLNNLAIARLLRCYKFVNLISIQVYMLMHSRIWSLFLAHWWKLLAIPHK